MDHPAKYNKLALGPQEKSYHEVPEPFFVQSHDDTIHVKDLETRLSHLLGHVHMDFPFGETAESFLLRTFRNHFESLLSSFG